MVIAPLPPDESQRTAGLNDYDDLDSVAEREFDDLTYLASQICGTPIALITLVDSERQWFKSTIGLQEDQTLKASAFCAHAVLDKSLFVVPDALEDERFRNNPWVLDEPRVRFYAGAPLISPEGHALGTLCVIDRKPRRLEPSQAEALVALSQHVVRLLEMRGLVKSLGLQQHLLRGLVDAIPHVMFWKDRNSTYVGCNNAFAKSAGLVSPADIVGKTDYDLPWTREESDFYRECDQRTMTDGTSLIDIEETQLQADGAHLHILTTKVPLRDETGKVNGILGFYRDVTDRRLAEDRFQTIFQSTGIGIMLSDAFGQIVTPNRAFQAMLGYGEELNGVMQKTITHPADWETSAELYRQLVAGERKTFQVETRYISKDGREVWANTSVSRLENVGATGPVAVALIENITERKNAEQAVLASERFARSTVDALTAHIAILDEQGVIIAVNQAWRNFATQNPPAPSNFAQGINYLKLCESATGPCSEDALSVAAGIRSVLTGEGSEFELEYPCHSPTQQRWFVARVSRFGDDGPVRVVVSHENVTTRRLLQEKLRHDSLHDTLTGLPNRMLFNDRVEQCLKSFKRNPGKRFAVLFIDLDRFKIINDSLGHAAGDKVLITIAERLNTCLRKTDTVGREEQAVTTILSHDDDSHTVARLGGDEFTVLLENLRDDADAARVADRILDLLSQPIAFAEHELSTTASIGIVNGSESYANAHDLLRDADSAMYRAKADGKSRYTLFDSTMHQAAVARLELENSLRHAIGRGELLLYYQPIVSLATRKLHGFEALIRWQRGGRLVSPLDFIPIAEDTGLIVPIGTWVLTESCRQLAAWQTKFPSMSSLSMSINVSRKQLGDPQLVPHLEAMLLDTRLNPECLKIEITESALIHDTAVMFDTLTRIKATGVKLSMDDFGTGYSSLSCLHQFPIDVVKIDRSFIMQLEGRRNAAGVVRGIVALAHSLGMQVVAEGLETTEQVAFLQAIECDLGQGYLFAKPLPHALAEQMIGDQPMFRPKAA